MYVLETLLSKRWAAFLDLPILQFHLFSGMPCAL